MSKISDEKPINILMLNYEFPPLGGGAGNATRYLLKEFAKYPYLNIDLVSSSGNKFKVEMFSNNITMHFLDINKNNQNLHYQTIYNLMFFSLKAYNYARRMLNRKKYNLCHAFFGIPCGLIALQLRLPYIVSLRGSDVPFYNNRFYWLDKLFLKNLSKKVWENAEKVVANSEGLKELAQTTAPYLKFDVITNGVDTSQFVPPKNKTINNRLKLISTGRLIERKGYDYLIKALKDNDRVELTLIGEGKMANPLKMLAQKNNVNIKFLGRIDHNDLPDHLKKADIFVLPSLNEGMSNSVLEAMACGLPVIVTDTGGSRELIKGNGYIIKKGSIAELKDTINGYLKDRSLIKIHGANSRKIAENLGWDEIAGLYERIYRIHEKNN